LRCHESEGHPTLDRLSAGRRGGHFGTDRGTAAVDDGQESGPRLAHRQLGDHPAILDNGGTATPAPTPDRAGLLGRPLPARPAGEAVRGL